MIPVIAAPAAPRPLRNVLFRLTITPVFIWALLSALNVFISSEEEKRRSQIKRVSPLVTVAAIKTSENLTPT